MTGQRKAVLGFQGRQTWKVGRQTYGRKLTGTRFVCRFPWCYLWADKNIFFPPHTERRPFTQAIYRLLAGRKWRGRVFLLCLLFLKCL